MTWFKYFGCIIVWSISYGCISEQEHRWCKLDAMRLPQSNVSFLDVLFLSNSEAYIVGSEYINSKEQKAVIYSLQGNYWKRTLFESGIFTKIVKTKKEIFTVLYSGMTLESKVFKLDSFGRFQFIFSFNGYIRELNFIDNTLFFLVKKNKSSEYNLYRTIDNGKSYTKVELNYKIGASSVLARSQFCYISFSTKSLIRPDILVKVDLNKMTEKIIDIPKNYYFHCLSLDLNNDLFLVAKAAKSKIKKRTVSVWKYIDKKDSLSFLSSFNLHSEGDFPIKIKGNKKEILIVTAGVGNKLFRSYDKGKEFKSEKKKYSTLEPLCFADNLKDTSFYTFGYVNGIGIIQSDYCSNQ